MQTPHITASLRLVKSELDLVLRQAERALSEYANYWEAQNRDAFDQAAQCLRQTAGVLEVVGLPGALELARALSQTVDRLGQGDENDAQRLLPAIVRGLTVQSRYLGQGAGDSPVRPELLLPTINQLRALLGEPALAEARFFEPAILLPKGDRGFVLDPDLRQLAGQVRRLRLMYQLGLLAVLREANLPHGYFLLKRALCQFENLSGDTGFADFCRLARAAVEALESGDVSPSRERRLVFGQVDRQFKQLLGEPLELESFAAPAPLLQALLYLIALAEPATPLLTELKSAAELNGHPSEALLTLERAALEDAGRGALPAARKEFKTELDKLIGELTVLSEQPELVREAPQRLHGQLIALGQTLDMLDLPEEGLRLRQAGERVATEAAQLDRERLHSLASELMDVEVRLSQLLGVPTAPAEPESANPQVVASQEARKLLAQVQERLTAFIANDWNREELDGAPEKLDTVCAGLQHLKAERAAVVLRTCAQFVREHLLAGAANPPSEPQALEVLADAIICIDYYLDGLAGDQGLRQGVIELAEESAQTLARMTKAA